MTQANTINDLRAITILTDITLVLRHTNPKDGGGGFFFYNPNVTRDDNNGTIIKPNSISGNGRWVRQIDGYINVRFFGAFGLGNDYTAAIQNAIDFASGNNVDNFVATGNTVFFPCGNYFVDNLILKRGVCLSGECVDTGVITAISTGTTGNYMLEIDKGPIPWTNISNLSLTSQHPTKGCMHFKAQPPEKGQQVGGLWMSNFKNIWITSFKGHSIYFEGGMTNYNLPNQFIILENVRATRSTENSNSLLMTGQQGQVTFLNCQFDGTNIKGQNIVISGPANFSSAVVSFINCTVQSSEYGIWIDYAENITIDNCWFEDLDVAITVKVQRNQVKVLTS